MGILLLGAVALTFILLAIFGHKWNEISPFSAVAAIGSSFFVMLFIYVLLGGT